MTRRARLDAELVRRGLTPSREQAAALIAAGRVHISGQPALKAATAVTPDTPVRILPAPDGTPDYVSRGGHKLAPALTAFASIENGLHVAGRHCLDAGASTGGFTDALLRADAATVIAADVGYGQLAWSLRTDPRVTVLDRVNVRHLTPDMLGGPVSLTVADLSFIGLRVVLPALAHCTTPNGDLVLLVKPQFEVGKDQLGAGGVVRNHSQWKSSIVDVATAATEHHLTPRAVHRSTLPGPAGNIEFLLWLSGPDTPTVSNDQNQFAASVDAAVTETADSGT